MNFELQSALSILERTPRIVRLWLENLDETWTHTNEGGDSWSPYDIVGHFIHGEKTDWMARLDVILHQTNGGQFVPFDRFAQFEASKGLSLSQLLDQFETLREDNLKKLRSIQLTDKTYSKTGLHPEFGVVTVKELLATWVVHDLGHLAQIGRVMAKQYSEDVGPWRAYLPILTRPI